MKIAIIGASGFTGKPTVDLALEKGLIYETQIINKRDNQNYELVKACLK